MWLHVLYIIYIAANQQLVRACECARARVHSRSACARPQPALAVCNNEQQQQQQQMFTFHATLSIHIACERVYTEMAVCTYALAVCVCVCCWVCHLLRRKTSLLVVYASQAFELAKRTNGQTSERSNGPICVCVCAYVCWCVYGWLRYHLIMGCTVYSTCRGNREQEREEGARAHASTKSTICGERCEQRNDKAIHVSQEEKKK